MFSYSNFQRRCSIFNYVLHLSRLFSQFATICYLETRTFPGSAGTNTNLCGTTNRSPFTQPQIPFIPSAKFYLFAAVIPVVVAMMVVCFWIARRGLQSAAAAAAHNRVHNSAIPALGAARLAELVSNGVNCAGTDWPVNALSMGFVCGHIAAGCAPREGEAKFIQPSGPLPLCLPLDSSRNGPAACGLKSEDEAKGCALLAVIG